MMRGAGGALALAVAALLVCCSADPHQEQDVSGNDHSAERYDAAGHKTRSVDDGNLVREVREIRHSGYVPYLLSRRFDFASPYGSKREPWALAPIEFRGYYGDGLPKRNFDEIDRSGLDTFVKKRNFDEIDRSSMPFPYATKRFYHLYGTNDIDTPVSSFDKKRYRPDYPMDEIDLSHFPIGSKRSQDDYPLVPRNLL
uniref:Orcokinin 2 splicing variant B n=1 Tax=Spodoptera exigua TaxID=7107 RepID=A0A385H8Z0_SPOEX|nr:orcokinin 2 splicing variant B [Spodoptera exigua]